MTITFGMLWTRAGRKRPAEDATAESASESAP
jgi:hypothetical protein